MAVYDRDYLTTLPLLYSKASEYSGGDWNKYNDDVGDTILKLLASSSHTVDYYFRKFLTALVLPNDDWDQKSLIWELTGYKPNYLRADYMMVQLYWPDCGLNSYVPIYQYTPFKVTADGEVYTFLCAQDYILTPLTTRANIRLVNGDLITIDQDYTQIKNDKIKLTDEDIDYDLVTVVVSGNKWTQVRNVFYSVNTEKIFSVHKEMDGTYVYLHNSWQTYVDSYDTSFYIYFVQSRYDFSLYTDECLAVEFKTELLSLDGDDVSQFYKIIPLLNSDEAIDASNLMPSTTEGNRAITVLDFESNASLFPGIAACRAFDWNTPEVCRDPFEVIIIACDSKGNLSEHMKMVLASYLESISSPLLTVKIIPPRFVVQDILVILDIGEYKGTLAEKELKRVAERTLAEFYEIGNLPPGRVVKTKELNSLLLHADSRINFVTTTFINGQIKSPYIIPILGNTVVITSAEAFTYYDMSEGYDKAYICFRGYEWLESTDKFNSIETFFTFNLKPNVLAPIDKLPMSLFDSAQVTESKPLFYIGSNDMPVAEFAYGSDFIHIRATGGVEDGPEFSFVYETDGNTVLSKKLPDEIETSVRAELKFVNSYGTSYINPNIQSIPLKHNDVDEIKDALAQALNNVPNLVDDQGLPFNITGDDIYYPEPVVPVSGGTLNTSAGIMPVNVSEPNLGGSDVQSDDLPVKQEKVLKQALNDVVADTDDSRGETSSMMQSDSETGVVTAGINSSSDNTSINKKEAVSSGENYFIYIPYMAPFKKDRVVGNEAFTSLSTDSVIKETTLHSYQQYLGFTYFHKGRFILDPNAYGDMTYNSQVELSITTKILEFISDGPDLYTESSGYNTPYMVKEKNGNPLHWYFVSTSPIQTVEETYEIGYGIYVGFNLLRDSAVYVTADEQTSRGFIYSAEMELNDFYILEV